MISEISQVQKHTYRMTLLACGTCDVRLRERADGVLQIKEMGAALECRVPVSIKDVHKYVSPPTQWFHSLVIA